MHEYPKGHPLYRPQKYRLSDEERQTLRAAIVAKMTALLGKGHQQVRIFAKRTDLNDDRLVSIAQAHDVDVSACRIERRGR